MVRELRALSLEELMTFLQSVNHISKFGDGHAADILQLVNISAELRLLNIHSLVRTPCWNHDRIVICLMLCILNMIVQVIDGIVSGADTFYIIMLHQTTG